MHQESGGPSRRRVSKCDAMQCNAMQCDGVDGWLVGLELVLGWENAEAEAKKESTNRLTAPYGDETCFGDVGVVVCFFVQGKSAEHGTEVCTTLEVWTNCLLEMCTVSSSAACLPCSDSCYRCTPSFPTRENDGEEVGFVKGDHNNIKWR